MVIIGIALMFLSLVIGAYVVVHVIKNNNSQTRRNVLLEGRLFILTSITAAVGVYFTGVDPYFWEIVALCLPMLSGCVDLRKGYRTSRAT